MRMIFTEFHQLLDAAPDPMIVVDREGRITALNREAERFAGWTEAELVGKPMSRLFPPRFHRLLRANGDPDGGPVVAAAHGTVSCFARRRDGCELPVELARRPLQNGHAGQSLVTFRDLTQWRRAWDLPPRHHEDASATLESIGDAVITTDITCRITYLNPVAERMTGWSAAEALGQQLDAVLPLFDETTRIPVANTAARSLMEGRSIDLDEGVLLLRRDGTEVPIGDSAAPVRDQYGTAVGVVLVIQDESEKRRVGHRLTYEATHDSLTGLVNRREFERRLARVVVNLRTSSSEHVLLSIDLDGFKRVNDAGGHDAGDALLRILSAQFNRHMRKRDTLARLGGDEFAVLLENCPFGDGARIAENLRAEVERLRFEWEGQVFTVGASIGVIPVCSEHGGVAGVLCAADAACYVAKESGGNAVHVERGGWEPAAAPPLASRRVTRLARAIDEGHFQLYAQSIVPLQPGAETRPRFEILLRLPDGEGRIQAAADFLPHADRYNLMPAIDRWVIRQALALLGQSAREHPELELPVCAINLHASALLDERLVPFVQERLAASGVPPGALCFELSETAALANMARTTRFLSGLRAAGCGVALEDVGSGVASFTYLRSLPVDFLKIGGRFVAGIVTDPVYGSIVSAVHQISASAGIPIIAKQVASSPVLEMLRFLGIDYAQGSALSPPVPLTDADGRMTMQRAPLAFRGREPTR
jgi:diguanylate cyclase (GGDEF)-like protein/PAS domain S-box-containing protein